MQRKTQLDAMLTDSQRYESKRQEVEAWLSRMEMRLQRVGSVGHTADVLEAQLREQKVTNWAQLDGASWQPRELKIKQILHK